MDNTRLSQLADSIGRIIIEARLLQVQIMVSKSEYPAMARMYAEHLYKYNHDDVIMVTRKLVLNSCDKFPTCGQIIDELRNNSLIPPVYNYKQLDSSKTVSISEFKKRNPEKYQNLFVEGISRIGTHIEEETLSEIL